MKPGLLLRRHRRRQRVDDAQRRRDVGESDAQVRLPGVPGEVYVVRIEPSHFDTLTFYVAFDNHRWNDFTPYLLRDQRRRQDVQVDRQQPAERRPGGLRARDSRGSAQPRPAVRRHVARRVRVARSRRRRGASSRRTADGAGVRPEDPSARPRADRGHARPRLLDRRHRAARADDAEGRGAKARTLRAADGVSNGARARSLDCPATATRRRS